MEYPMGYLMGYPMASFFLEHLSGGDSPQKPSPLPSESAPVPTAEELARTFGRRMPMGIPMGMPMGIPMGTLSFLI